VQTVKVLLVQLKTGAKTSAVYPLGLAYLAGALRGHVVRMVDQNLLSDPIAGMEPVVREFTPDVIGLSVRNLRFGPGYSSAEQSLRALHDTVEACGRICPRATFVIGGCAFSMFPERFLAEEPRLHFGVLLEGDLSFPQLLANLNKPHAVPGIYYRDGGAVRLSAPPALPDFGALPPPRRDLLDPALYQGDDLHGVQSKRGCELGCIYCSYPYLTGHRCRLRSPGDVADEVESLVRDYGVRQFTFVDNVFNVPESHAVAVCEALAARRTGATWSAWFNERFVNPRLLDLAVRAGCRCVELSPDGYSSASLKWLNKNITTRDIGLAYRALSARKELSVVYNFFTGIPGQGILSMLRQFLFVQRLRLGLGPRLRGVRLNPLWIEPNTPLAARALKEGKLLSNSDLFYTTLYEVGPIRVLRKWANGTRAGQDLLRRFRRRVSLGDFDDGLRTAGLSKDGSDRT
jgi:anaerobic magnesium-protoporphyrin IX monomethyl ester cyclase